MVSHYHHLVFARSGRSGPIDREQPYAPCVCSSAALHGLISMGLRLNEEVEGMASLPARPGAEPARVIRSAWMT